MYRASKRIDDRDLLAGTQRKPKTSTIICSKRRYAERLLRRSEGVLRHHAPLQGLEDFGQVVIGRGIDYARDERARVVPKTIRTVALRRCDKELASGAEKLV